MADWQIEPLDKRAVCQKRRRTMSGEPRTLDALPAEWRELLVRWVRRGGNSRWETLRNDAGVNRVQMADALLDWLLRNGWASVTEQWKLGGWWPQQVGLLHLPQLRAAFGIRDKEEEAQRWQIAREELKSCCSDNFAPALLALDELRPQQALARRDLIAALQRWQNVQQSGTRRDFALFARDDTKGLSESEWSWLEQALDLAEFRIERHTPLLLLAAPLTLNMQGGQLDLACCAGFAALTPETLQSATGATGAISRWQLVENRTSFERVAHQREHDSGVVWLPGFPPNWWHKAVGQLLDFTPAPAHIACDPDPAGIAIALKAAELWQIRGLKWLPWKMTADDLSALRVRKPLTGVDRLQLAALRQTTALPAQLAELAEWMLEHDEKGEQEGYM